MSQPEPSQRSEADIPALPSSATRPDGSASSLPDLFLEQEAPLIRYAYSLTGSRAVSEDIVQEVFLQLHLHWDDVANPVSWLFRSVRNRSLNHHRDHRREVLTDAPDDEARSDDPGESLLLRMEAAGFLRLLLAELPEKDRELVRLRYFEDLRYREISERTGLSVGNVGYRLHHLLKQLAENLRQIGIEDFS